MRPADTTAGAAARPAAEAPPPDDTVVEAPTPHIENGKAVFAGLDKISGRTISFDVAIGETVQFGALQVTPRACYTRPPTEATNTDAFVEVDEVTLQGEIKRIFTGWMFASSPGLHAVEHPIYDVWLTDCASPLNVKVAEPAVEAASVAGSGSRPSAETAPTGAGASASRGARRPAIAAPVRHLALKASLIASIAAGACSMSMCPRPGRIFTAMAGSTPSTMSAYLSDAINSSAAPAMIVAGIFNRRNAEWRSGGGPKLASSRNE